MTDGTAASERVEASATAMASVVASADLMALVLEHVVTVKKVPNPALHDEKVEKQYGVPLVQSVEGR